MADADAALNKIAEYVSTQPPGGHPEWITAELKPKIQKLLDEVAGEISAHWGASDGRAEGLAFALGYLHGRFSGHYVPGGPPTAPGPAKPVCPYTHAHTRHWCGYEGCRDS